MKPKSPRFIRLIALAFLAPAILFSGSGARPALGTTIARGQTMSGASVGAHHVSNGVIAFVGGFSNASLNTINPNGTHLRSLAGCTTTGCAISSFVWSNDGKRLAFVRGPLDPHYGGLGGANNSVYVVNANGSHERRLVGCGQPVGCFNYSLSWSPDGSMIAVSRQRSLYTVNVETHALRRITNCSPWFFSPDRKKSCVDLSPAWSPDGRRITFFRAFACGPGCPSQPFIVNADGSGLRRLSLLYGNGFGPLLSPNGRKIGFSGGNAIYSTDPNGSHLRLLVSAPPVSANQTQTFASWSPDSKHILYVSQPSMYPESETNVRTPSATGVWVMNADGTGRRRVYYMGCCGGHLMPLWSPDGKHIAFSSSFYSDYKSTPNASKTGLFIMDTNGRHIFRLLAGYASSFAWQPVP
jgi:Tol biopolymer transport system component